MSQLLDALTRASRPRRASDERSVRGVRAENIFASMGLAQAPVRRRPRLLRLTCWGLAAIAFTWAAVQWSDWRGASASHPTTTVRDAPFTTSSAPAPARAVPSSGVVTTAAVGEPRASGYARAEPAALPGSQRPRVAADRRAASMDQFKVAAGRQRAGDFDKALLDYQAILARGELTAQVHNNLGLLYQAQGRLGDAVRAFERSIAADPRYPKAYSNLGVVLLQAGRADDAVRQFRSAAALDPMNPDPHVNLALAQKATGQVRQARESLLRALDLAPNGAPAHYNLAVLYDQSGEIGRAAEHYRAFLANAGVEYSGRVADVRARLETVEKMLH